MCANTTRLSSVRRQLLQVYNYTQPFLLILHLSCMLFQSFETCNLQFLHTEEKQKSARTENGRLVLRLVGTDEPSYIQSGSITIIRSHLEDGEVTHKGLSVYYYLQDVKLCVQKFVS